jgi:hypothetical protein
MAAAVPSATSGIGSHAKHISVTSPSTSKYSLYRGPSAPSSPYDHIFRRIPVEVGNGVPRLPGAYRLYELSRGHKSSLPCENPPSEQETPSQPVVTAQPDSIQLPAQPPVQQPVQTAAAPPPAPVVNTAPAKAAPTKLTELEDKPKGCFSWLCC